MVLLLKDDVLPSRKFPDGSIRRIQPDALLIIMIVQSVYTSMGIPDLMITSLLDGTHMDNSLHYKGMAVDFRTKTTGMGQRIYDLVRKALPLNLYDVLLEDKDLPNEHLHVEAQNHAFE